MPRSRNPYKRRLIEGVKGLEPTNPKITKVTDAIIARIGRLKPQEINGKLHRKLVKELDRLHELDMDQRGINRRMNE